MSELISFYIANFHIRIARACLYDWSSERTNGKAIVEVKALGCVILVFALVNISWVFLTKDGLKKGRWTENYQLLFGLEGIWNWVSSNEITAKSILRTWVRTLLFKSMMF